MSLLERLSDEFGPPSEVGLDPALGRVVVSQRPELGQFQVNGAMAAGRQAGRPPRQVAQSVIEQIGATDRFATLEVAGPGFINITLTDEALAEHIRASPRTTVRVCRSGDPSPWLSTSPGPTWPSRCTSATCGQPSSATACAGCSGLSATGRSATPTSATGAANGPAHRRAGVSPARPPHFDSGSTGPYPEEPAVDSR